jgi:hypothetical protein
LHVSLFPSSLSNFLQSHDIDKFILPVNLLSIMSCKCGDGKSWHVTRIIYNGGLVDVTGPCQKEGCKCKNFAWRDTSLEMANAGNWSVSQIEELEKLKGSHEQQIHIPYDFHEWYLQMKENVRG